MSDLPGASILHCGAIAAFVKKDAILKYFGPQTRKIISYPVAASSGIILAVCSCTILPLFAGIYKKGSGLGPATTFLFAGPAINVLAIVYTAQVLGYNLGLARAVAAMGMSIIIGLIMMAIFRREEEGRTLEQNRPMINVTGDEETRPLWVVPAFFILLIAILLIGSSKLDWVPKLAAVYLLTVAVALLLIYHFQRMKSPIGVWRRGTLPRRSSHIDRRYLHRRSHCILHTGGIIPPLPRRKLSPRRSWPRSSEPCCICLRC